jgi:hypothetical protein
MAAYLQELDYCERLCDVPTEQCGVMSMEARSSSEVRYASEPRYTMPNAADYQSLAHTGGVNGVFEVPKSYFVGIVLLRVFLLVQLYHVL